MRTLTLELLTGPESTTAENFELLCMELARYTDPASSFHRIASPDGGIDFSGVAGDGEVIAAQCKAYARYGGGFLESVRSSVAGALRSQRSVGWTRFFLYIPFVLTAKQRERVVGELEPVRSWYIIDGDELETRLYDSPEIASRFFPSVRFVQSAQSGPLTLCRIKEEVIRLNLNILGTGQRVPVDVGCDITIGGLIAYLRRAFYLPDTLIVQVAPLPAELAPIDWQLLEGEDPNQPNRLDPTALVGESGLTDGAVVHLQYSAQVQYDGGFARPIGMPHPPLALRLYSKVWADSEMGTDVIAGEYDIPAVTSDLVMARSERHLQAYLSAQVDRLRGSNSAVTSASELPDLSGRSRKELESILRYRPTTSDREWRIDSSPEPRLKRSWWTRWRDWS